MKRSLRCAPALAALAALVLAACGNDTKPAGIGSDVGNEPSPDAGVLDGGLPDAGANDGGLPDAGCLNPCGSDCCAEDEVCNQGRCEPICVPQCEGRECGPDGCDGTCGTCGEDETCNPTSFQCDTVCVPDPDEELCNRFGRGCGSLTARNNCGEELTVECGECTAPSYCDATTHQCTCPAETDVTFCARMHVQCGLASGTDNCGNPREVANCGACAPDVEWCVDGRCACRPEADAVFCARFGKECGNVAGTDRCGPRVTNCGGCTPPDYCGSNGYCRGATPSNDTCARPELLSFNAAGTATVTGDTSGATNASTGSCGTSGGFDLVYTFTTTSPSAVRATVNAAAGTPMLYLQSTCGTVEVPGACNVGTELVIPNLPAGTWFLWVDSNLTGGAPFTLDVTLEPPLLPPANDLCTGAEVLLFDTVTHKATVAGDTTGANNDEGGLCASMTGPEVVYTFTLTDPSAFVATVTRDATRSTSYQPVLWLRTLCPSTSSADQVACASSTSGTTRLIASSLAAGTYYLVVDGLNYRYGAFNLTAELKSVAWNDTCAAAEELLLDPVTGLGSVDADTTAATGDYNGACTSAGRDLVYSFTTMDVKTVEVQLAPAAGSTARATLYLRSVCDDTATELICTKAAAAGDAVRIIRGRLPAGTYYVFVDAQASNAGGPFSLSISAIDPPLPPANDTCAGATAIVPDPVTGAATITGETTYAIGDYSATCGVTDGPDLVYALTVTRDTYLAATLTRDPADNGFRPALYLRSNCPGSTAPADDSCDLYLPYESGATTYDYSWNTGWADVVGTALPAGTWYLVVDGSRGSAGHFTLDIQTGPGRHNDNCVGPETMVLDANGVAIATGNARYSTNQTQGPCGGAYGNELVYQFTTTGVGSLSILLDQLGGSSQATSVYLRTACADRTTEKSAWCFYASGGHSATLDLPRVDGGTYYLFVDDFGSSLQGPFRVTVTSTLFPPINDTCADAQQLVLDPVTNKATAQGDITQGANDYSGLCGYTTMIGVDHVYFVELRAPESSLTAKVTSDASRNLNVYIRSACDSDSSFDQVGCGTGSAGVSLASAPSIPSGRYYIFVDGFQATYTGTYALEVSASTPPSNNTCASPQALTFDAITGVATGTGDTAGGANFTVGTCQSANAGELIYRFTTTALQDVDVFVKPQTGSAYRGYVYVRSSCDDQATELGCAYNTGTSASVHVPLLGLPAGTWFVFVDTPHASSYRGPFELTVTPTAPAARPANDTCATATALNLPSQGQVIVNADTTTAVNDLRGNCGTADATMTGGDLVYSFALNQRSQVLVEHTRSATTYKPGFYIRRTCDRASDEVACLVNTNTGSANNTKTIATVLDAGTYYLIVDGAVHTGGAFTMKVSTYPMIAGDTCDSAIPITFTGGVAQLLGDNTNATDLAAGIGCQTTPTTGGEVVYSFTTSAEQDIAVVARPGASGAYKAYVYLRAACGQPSSELACAFNSGTSSASWKVYRAPAATYYLFVDSYTSSTLTGKGLYDVTVTLTSPAAAPAGDTCATAIPLDLTTGSATVTGTTLGATNDYSHYGMCGSSKTVLFGNDMVYSFTLRTPATVVAETTRVASTYSPVTYIRSVCDSNLQKDQQTCSTSVSSNVNATLPVGLGAGTYYVIVDGGQISASGPSSGDYTLRVTATTSPAPVAGDGCFNVPMLPAFDANGVATKVGTTDGGTHHGEGSCYGFGSATYPDVVYGFELTRRATVRVEVAPTTGSALHADFYIRRDCADKASELFCAYKTTSDAVSTVLQALPAGTYYVWVKAVGSTASGPFNLTVTQFQPPANDSCGGVQELQFDSAGDTATVLARTEGALDDAAGTCGGAGTGDAVFHFNLAAQRKIVASVKRDPLAPALDPVVYLRRSCASALASDEIACGAGWYGTATASVHSAAPGDYYVWVDGRNATMGSYRLQVKLFLPETAPLNESCFAPEALQFAGNQATALGSTDGAFDEATGSCSRAGASDLVYSFVLSAPKAFSVTVTPVDLDFQPAVYIRSSCGSLLSSDERGCVASGSAGVAAMATVDYAPAGTYFVWVDGASSVASGAFTLAVDLSAPIAPPANDACGAPQALTRGTSWTGDTAHAVDDYGAALSAACGGSLFAGPDLVFSYTPSVPGDFTVTLAPTLAWDAAVWVTEGNCAGTGAACTAAGNAGGGGIGESVPVPAAVAGTTYYIVVDGVRRSDAGPFTILVQ